MPSIEIRRLLPGDEVLLDNVAPPAPPEGHMLFVARDDGRVVAQATGGRASWQGPDPTQARPGQWHG
ncbi:protein of unknown function [Aminobacter niigataensis]|nr:protein of unknown function [Aminobacter niigataensis]